MKKVIKVILVQYKDHRNEPMYRIAKLVGATDVHTDSKPRLDLIVGNCLERETARDLADCNRYEVTVTEKGGKP